MTDLTLDQARDVLDQVLDSMRGLPTSYLRNYLLGNEGLDVVWRAAGAPPLEVSAETSDGFHTFNELYEFRRLYNAALFNEWAAAGRYGVHKSWRHHDGDECFGGSWFIVMAQLPTGQVSNHYPAGDWSLFAVPERERAAEWDGHTAADVAARLRAFLDAGGDA